MELKTLAVEAVEFKFDEARKGLFAGYASKFNGVDSYGDTVLPGAYAQTLSNRSRPIQMRWNHFGPVIGKWTKAVEDDNGLYVEGELTPGHSVADDVYASMKHGAVTGLSIGFRIPSGGSAKEGKLRQLKRIDLIEISVVEAPADLGAQVGNVKSFIDEAESLKEIESLLRDAAGFTRADACALVSRIKALAHGERDAEAKRLADELAATFQQFRAG
jgi:HK97 family phage prohead protease